MRSCDTLSINKIANPHALLTEEIKNIKIISSRDMEDLKKGCQILPFTSYTSRTEFTKIKYNFAWGAATAAYQVNSHILML